MTAEAVVDPKPVNRREFLNFAWLVSLGFLTASLGGVYNGNSQEGKFICPCHGSQFQPDGTYIRGPAPRNLDRFVVQVASPDGQILSETDPKTGGPVALPQ